MKHGKRLVVKSPGHVSTLALPEPLPRAPPIRSRPGQLNDFQLVPSRILSRRPPRLHMQI